MKKAQYYIQIAKTAQFPMAVQNVLGQKILTNEVIQDDTTVSFPLRNMATMVFLSEVCQNASIEAFTVDLTGALPQVSYRHPRLICQVPGTMNQLSPKLKAHIMN